MYHTYLSFHIWCTYFFIYSMDKNCCMNVRLFCYNNYMNKYLTSHMCRATVILLLGCMMLAVLLMCNKSNIVYWYVRFPHCLQSSLQKRDCYYSTFTLHLMWKTEAELFRRRLPTVQSKNKLASCLIQIYLRECCLWRLMLH